MPVEAGFGRPMPADTQQVDPAAYANPYTIAPAQPAAVDAAAPDPGAGQEPPGMGRPHPEHPTTMTPDGIPPGEEPPRSSVRQRPARGGPLPQPGAGPSDTALPSGYTSRDLAPPPAAPGQSAGTVPSAGAAPAEGTNRERSETLASGRDHSEPTEAQADRGTAHTLPGRLAGTGDTAAQGGAEGNRRTASPPTPYSGDAPSDEIDNARLKPQPDGSGTDKGPPDRAAPTVSSTPDEAPDPLGAGEPPPTAGPQPPAAQAPGAPVPLSSAAADLVNPDQGSALRSDTGEADAGPRQLLKAALAGRERAELVRLHALLIAPPAASDAGVQALLPDTSAGLTALISDLLFRPEVRPEPAERRPASDGTAAPITAHGAEAGADNATAASPPASPPATAPTHTAQAQPPVPDTADAPQASGGRDGTTQDMPAKGHAASPKGPSANPTSPIPLSTNAGTPDTASALPSPQQGPKTSRGLPDAGLAGTGQQAARPPSPEAPGPATVPPSTASGAPPLAAPEPGPGAMPADPASAQSTETPSPSAPPASADSGMRPPNAGSEEGAGSKKTRTAPGQSSKAPGPASTRPSTASALRPVNPAPGPPSEPPLLAPADRYPTAAPGTDGALGGTAGDAPGDGAEADARGGGRGRKPPVGVGPAVAPSIGQPPAARPAQPLGAAPVPQPTGQSPDPAEAAPLLDLATRLVVATPLAAQGLQEAFGLLWSAMPATATGRPEARMVLLRARARIAALAPEQAQLVTLVGMVHDLLATAGSEADRRMAARTVLARMRYAAAGSPRARALVRAALAAVMPGLDADNVTVTEGLASRVAGLVLFAPYLRVLFDRVGVLDPGGRLPADRVARARALLRLLSGAEAGPADPLERVLLGLPPGQPVDAAPPDAEMATLVDGLLRAVVAQWGALGRTSPDGLREAFVRREGDLTLEAEGVARLRVMPGPFDMMLDRLPWSIALIRAPWMAGPLHVRWRSHGER